MKEDVKMNAIFKKICNIDDTVEISDFMSSNTIDSWDSLANIQLIAELEEAFNIEFSFDELLEVENWGNLKAIVKNKIMVGRGK